MNAEILFIPMGNKAKCIIKGKIFCKGSGIEGDFWNYGTGNFVPKTFMTTSFYMKNWFPGGSQGVRSFFSKGRPVRKVLDLNAVYAPFHIHPCDRMV